MKIVLTSETYLPRIGGAEIHVKNLFERIKNDNNEVCLVTNELGDVEQGVTRLPWSRKNLIRIIRVLWKVTKNADIIHAHYCHRLALIVSIVGRVRGIPVFVTLHGMGILDHPGQRFFPRLGHSFYRYWSLQLCTHVISTSEDLAIVADKYISRKKMTVILNGYDADLFLPMVKERTINGLDLSEKKLILTIRRLVPKNGLHYLVEAMPYILEKIPNAHYLVAGDGTLRTYIEQRVDDLHLRNNVTFLGMVNNDSVFEYTACADVVVFPSTAESSSIACAEAMGMGKVIVASRVGGLVELLGEDASRGYLVDLVPWSGSNYDAPLNLSPERYQALAQAIIEALSSDLKNSIKAENARSYAQKELSWKAIYEKTKFVYLSKKK